MASREELERGVEFSKGRADRYREAAANGGEGNLTAAQLAEQSRQFEAHAARLAASLARRDDS